MNAPHGLSPMMGEPLSNSEELPVEAASGLNDPVRQAIEKLEMIAAYPPEGHRRRTEDGYPAEIVYDDFAYKRIVDTYREAIRDIATELKALVA